MEVEQSRPLGNAPAMTFDEASMERSKNFVKALQELKNLRPQLYSAAEYCEKSFLNSEHKQMVLDNIRDYTVQALVNAVDHLGTVAYKLTDLLEQQTSEVSTLEVKVTCLNQQLLTCHTYMDKEGIRQQQLSAADPKNHKRYVLPNVINKKVHFTPLQNDPREIHVRARPQIHPSASPPPKTLSWLFASETKPTLKASQKSSNSSSKLQSSSPGSSGEFEFIGYRPSIWEKSPAHAVRPGGSPLSSVILQAFGITDEDPSLDYRPLTPLRSFGTPAQRAADVRSPARSKGMLSAFFVKQKSPKLKAGRIA